MNPAAGIDSPLGSDQCLADNLTAVNPLPADIRADTAKQVYFKRFKIKRFKEGGDSLGHLNYPYINKIRNNDRLYCDDLLTRSNRLTLCTDVN